MCTTPNIRREVVLSGALPKNSVRIAFALLLSSAALFAAPQLRAQSDDSQSSQDVAEAARQERARKQNQSKHVYTNEDLRRGKILTPEDQSRATAANRKPHMAPAPAAKPDAEPLDANSNAPREPLGDVARRYRNARRDSQKTSPFHLPSQQPELAAPKMLASPPNPMIDPAVKPVPRVFAPSNPSLPKSRGSFVPAPSVPSSPMHRVDPFSRRRTQPTPPLVAVRPVGPRGTIQPSFPAPSRTRPASPAVSAPSVIVRQGDTLWTLSRQHLGRGTRWLELMAANPNLADPAHLVPGTALTLPPRIKTHRPSAGSITVRAGDSLSKIALAAYGHSSLWPCIAHANPTLSNPDRLSIGQSLVLPSSCEP